MPRDTMAFKIKIEWTFKFFFVNIGRSKTQVQSRACWHADTLNSFVVRSLTEMDTANQELRHALLEHFIRCAHGRNRTCDLRFRKPLLWWDPSPENSHHRKAEKHAGQAQRLIPRKQVDKNN